MAAQSRRRLGVHPCRTCTTTIVSTMDAHGGRDTVPVQTETRNHQRDAGASDFAIERLTGAMFWNEELDDHRLSPSPADKNNISESILMKALVWTADRKADLISRYSNTSDLVMIRTIQVNFRYHMALRPHAKTSPTQPTCSFSLYLSLSDDPQSCWRRAGQIADQISPADLVKLHELIALFFTGTRLDGHDSRRP
jgi:hypothetical protein